MYICYKKLLHLNKHTFVVFVLHRQLKMQTKTNAKLRCKYFMHAHRSDEMKSAALLTTTTTISHKMQMHCSCTRHTHTKAICMHLGMYLCMCAFSLPTTRLSMSSRHSGADLAHTFHGHLFRNCSNIVLLLAIINGCQIVMCAYLFARMYER